MLCEVPWSNLKLIRRYINLLNLFTYLRALDLQSRYIIFTMYILFTIEVLFFTIEVHSVYNRGTLFL